MGTQNAAVGNAETFPDALRAAIARRGDTQRAAAARLGVTPQYVSEWLAGRRVPGPNLIAAVARYVGLSRDELRALIVPTYREELARVAAELERATAALERLTDRVRKVERRLDAYDKR